MISTALFSLFHERVIRSESASDSAFHASHAGAPPARAWSAASPTPDRNSSWQAVRPHQQRSASSDALARGSGLWPKPPLSS